MHKKNNLIIGQHYPALNGLRAFAVLSVIIAHCTMQAAEVLTPEHQQYWYTMTTGWVGVDLFFVLSGFLITGILLDTRDHKNRFKNFFIRRALRILPLYYFVLTSYFVFMFSMGLFESFSSQHLMYLFYIGNWDEFIGYERPFELDHFWSLAVEEQFYIFWPFLLLFFVRKNFAKSLCISMIILSVLIRIFMVLNHMTMPAFDITIARLDELASGALLAILMKEGRMDILNLKNTKYLFFTGLSIVIFLTIGNGSFFGRDPIIVAFGIIALPMLFIPTILWVFLLNENHMYKRILQHRPLVFIGKISYGMYIYHWFIIRILNETKIIKQDAFGFYITQLLFLLLTLILTIFTAWLSYTLFESKLLKLKDRWAPYNTK